MSGMRGLPAPVRGAAVARHEAGAATVRSRIGPNAVIQVAEASRGIFGPEQTRRLFAAAGLEWCLVSPPAGMIDETDVSRLHRTLRERLDPAEGRAVLVRAGALTADYLLAHRIPRAAQVVLQALPPAVAARVLLAAVGRHAWTFAGSGRFGYDTGSVAWRRVVLSIADNPLCRGVRCARPACVYYAATFESLFQALVHARSTVVETQCEACAAQACLFELRWSAVLS
jgi:divinyl protochlorophyllide a 8-vinyl-reductase